MARPKSHKTRKERQEEPTVSVRTKAEIVAELSLDNKRRLLFLARSLLVVGLWTIPPRNIIRKLVAEIDVEIDRDRLVGREEEVSHSLPDEPLPAKEAS